MSENRIYGISGDGHFVDAKNIECADDQEATNRPSEHLSDLLTLSYEPMLAWRLDGVIEFWNAGAERLYGFAPGEAVGRRSHSLLQTKLPIEFIELHSHLRNERYWVRGATTYLQGRPRSHAGLIGFAISRHGYAWLIGAITGNLVMLMALDQPQITFTIAVNRVFDVTIGTAAALLVTFLLPEDTTAPSPPANAPTPPPLLFWTRRHAAEFERWLREIWPLVMHACRGGLTVMLLPLLVRWLAPLGPSSMAVTAVAVLAVPTTAVIEPDGRTIIQRSVYRLLGCALGALLGLFCVHWVGSDFLVWLLLLTAGTWLSSQIQSGSTGIGYVGTQAEIAFLLSMIQGQGPPLSPTPGLDRFAGIMVGLSVLLVITMVVSLFRLTPPTTTPAHSD